MLEIFTRFADWLAYTVLGLSAETKLGDAVHFFIEDVSKIYVLLVVMIYLIALIRAALNVERVRDYLAGKNKGIGYVLGSLFGAVTPFCSCSSIPVFLGFTSAGIPVGITMAFLLTSPLINEVAVLLLLSLVGWKITLMYVLIGMMTGILGGAFLDSIKAERWLRDFALKALQKARQAPVSNSQSEQPSLTLKQRHQFAKQEALDIFSRVWKWVLIGVGLGAALHGVVPDGWIAQHFGEGQWWSVPAAVVLGIPLYSNATGVIPVMESLLVNGLPVGTTIAFCMSTVAASFPEFILLKQVMQWRLLSCVFVMLLVSFTLVGWLLNALAALM
ncbi:permease [uncultured Alteromonas sp.]|jgi:uncharacterized membrane protein YraQ (UPF0718 family)|uniref:permease n=1 Tax=uncultured Alteromonas sp. TaxID=179113 RepID=UPI0025DD9751|nr:permease [uncultured Alteromonas sp.]